MGALLDLDDRLLADIGLRRAEVAAVASGQLPLGQLTVHGPVGAGDGRPPLSAVSPPEPDCWDAAA